jgi:hypothetical protein
MRIFIIDANIACEQFAKVWDGAEIDLWYKGKML